MKNILFWAGLFVATFWDEVLLASVKPKKTKRQQQFFETGETAQYFIGAVEDELVTLLKRLFTVKKIVKSKNIFFSPEWDDIDIYEIKGGVKVGHMTLFTIPQGSRALNSRNDTSKGNYYEAYIANGYSADYDDNISYKLFGENDIYAFDGYKNDILYPIWKKYILEWETDILYDKVENFEQIKQLAETNIELAFILLSGVPNIKKILS